MSPKNYTSYSQFAVRRKFLYPANEDPNFNSVSHELDVYEESIQFTDYLVRINLLEFDKFKETEDDAYNTGPNTKLEIEVPKHMRDLSYQDQWLIRNKNANKIVVYRVLEITTRMTGGCVLDYLVDLEVRSGETAVTKCRI